MPVDQPNWVFPKRFQPVSAALSTWVVPNEDQRMMAGYTRAALRR